jgi:hypothetical protein
MAEGIPDIPGLVQPSLPRRGTRVSRRATSYNFELVVDGQVIHPAEISEFGEGEEGRLEIQDGCIRYKTRDEIVTTPEISILILLQQNLEYYNILYHWHHSKDIKDVLFIGRDSTGTAKVTLLISNCECVNGKKKCF